MMHSHTENKDFTKSKLVSVLILVVMDDALAQAGELKTKSDVLRLNPCCNG